MNNSRDWHPISDCVTLLQAFFKDKHLADSTGFYYSHKGEVYLITTWHSVTGINPESKEYIGSKAVSPTKIRIMKQKPQKDPDNLEAVFVNVPLYKKSKPVWFEHRKHRSSIDIVAIPIVQFKKYKLYAVNDAETTQEDLGVSIGREVFVVGYPFGQTSFEMSLWPIWKKASIASEPSLRIGSMPQFLIDTTTSKGMSGSPVIIYNSFFVRVAGIYSGRYGSTDDLESLQLGRVWRRELIDELLEDPVAGSINI